MADYVVSARKYRPRSFDEVIGQSHITTTLTNAIKNEQLAHALLFCGPRGIGKTTCARILAKTINEFDDSALEGSGMALNIFELDGASNNSVDDIRSLIDQVRYPPQQGKYKVYIIDEVHMLSKGAFNAFLKTLEEPPSYAIFILATTEKNKVLPTILSRCQIFDFNRIDIPEIEDHLLKISSKEEIEAEKGAIHLIAQKSDGSLRDALSLFDQLVAFSGDNKLTYEQVLKNLHILDYDYFLKLTEQLSQGDHESAVLLFDEVIGKGFDGLQLILGFLEHLRNLLMLQATSTSKLVQVPENALKEYESQSQEIDKSLLLSWISVLQSCEQQYRFSQNQKILVELTLVRMAHVLEVLDLPEPQTAGTKKKTSRSPESKELEEEKEPKPQQSEETELSEKPEIESAPEPEVQSVNKPEIEEQSAEDQEDTEPPTQVSEPEKTAWNKTEKNTDTEKKKGEKISIKPRISASLDLDGNEQEEEGEPDLLLLQKEIPEDQEFGQEKLEKSWKEYVEKNKSAFGAGLARLMERYPKVEGNAILLELSNPIEENHMNSIKAELNYHLKKSLRNKQAELTIIHKKETEEKKPYTSLEKFNALAKDNPALNDLRDQLGLEIEF